MTHHPDNALRMKLLDKVARGLDLPLPAASIPVQSAALLPDEDDFGAQLFDAAVRTPETEAGESGAASGDEARPGESDPDAPALPGAADNNRAAFAASQKDGRIPSTLQSQAVILKADSSFDPDTDSAPAGLKFESPRVGHPVSQPAAAEAYTEPFHGQAGHLQAPAGTSPNEKNRAAGNPPRVPRGRWVFLHAGEPQSRILRPVSRMLRPVFDMPNPVDTPEPAAVRKTASPALSDLSSASDGSRNPTGRDGPPAGSEIPLRLPDLQPAGDAGSRIPDDGQIAVAHMQAEQPTAITPRGNADQSAAITAAASDNPSSNRGRHKKSAVMQPEVPAAKAAQISGGASFPAADPAGAHPADPGGVSVGRINIQVRSRRPAEEDWPAPPRYTSHSITEDWEWSCHYGK